MIVAGGSSSRLGTFKPLAQLCGRPLISYAIEFAKGFSHRIFILVKNTEQGRLLSPFIKGSNFDMVFDREPGSLTPSVSEAIRQSGAERVFVMACDMPFLERGLPAILDLCLQGTRWGAAVPIWPNGYIEPLAAMYDPRMAPPSSGLESMRQLCAAMGARYVDVFGRGISPRSFMNINSPSDLREAERVLQASLLTST